MLKRLILMMLMIMPLAVLEARAISTYNILVDESGEAAVVVEINAVGLVTLPIQPDSSGIRVKGALYRTENSTMELSIASMQKAVILYKTSMLTDKTGENWTLRMDLLGDSDVTLALPKHAVIKSTVPKAFIDSEEYNKLVFQNTSSIEIEYAFGEKPSNSLLPLALGAGAVLAGAGAAAYILSKNKKPLKQSAKEKILKTLSVNERAIVQTLMEKGEMKRSDLEKTTKMAKSSLANTLNNLERKNIVEIDKTYTAHFVKFTGWFDEL
jgi:uncharacterized membrane protein